MSKVYCPYCDSDLRQIGVNMYNTESGKYKIIVICPHCDENVLVKATLILEVIKQT